MNLHVFSSRIAPHTGSVGITFFFTPHTTTLIDAPTILLSLLVKRIKTTRNEKEKKDYELRTDVSL